MRIRLWAFCLAALCVGCSGGPPSSSESANGKAPVNATGSTESEDAIPPDTGTPEGALEERFASGYTQINAALDLLETARRAGSDAMESHTGTGEGREAWLDYLDAVDSVGGQLTDLENRPTREEIAADFIGSDERRLKAIDELNIARFELVEATANANSILGKEVEGIFSDSWSAAERLENAIKALGGEVRNPG